VLFHLHDGQVDLEQAALYPQGQVRSTETVVALEKTFDDKVHPIRTTPEIGEAPITVVVVLPKFSSVRFSPHFLRTENRTDRIFSELNRTRTELVRTGSTGSVRFQNRFEQTNQTIIVYQQC